uniref:Uncharacterized protein n=1 Tax=Parascaris univalens TaxID=6257 RepID=A0A915ABA9_PARUN
FSASSHSQRCPISRIARAVHSMPTSTFSTPKPSKKLSSPFPSKIVALFIGRRCYVCCAVASHFTCSSLDSAIRQGKLRFRIFYFELHRLISVWQTPYCIASHTVISNSVDYTVIPSLICFSQCFFT